MYSEYEIIQMPLTLASCRNRVEHFLAKNELRLDDVDYYAVVSRLGDDTILAGGGLDGNIIKCIAVDDSLRGTGMSQRLVSHLLSVAQDRGIFNVKVFTKPQNAAIFSDLSFHTLATAPLAVLMENGMGGLSSYCNYLSSLRTDEGTNGVVVMNCNPFTLGHKHLIERAAAQVDHLYVIIVKEDKSLFSTRQRTAMARKACEDMKNVTVCDGSDYAISAATFPTYFLKQLTHASDTQMKLDINLFARHIAPALNATVRFVGTEPCDELTARYNELMKQLLPQQGVDVVEIDRLALGGSVVSASHVRSLIDDEKLAHAVKLVPETSVPYLVSKQAITALRKELTTTPKPGLIDTIDNGAHSDMNYDLMLTSIKSLEPYFDQLALLDAPIASEVQHIGIEAEKSMLETTGGVNTHRGALFSMGIAVVGVSQALLHGKQWNEIVKNLASDIPASRSSYGAMAKARHNVKGALDIAHGGYDEVSSAWLPFYQSLDDDENAAVKTLLLIMSQLDDTNIIHRVGFERAQQVKNEAASSLEDFSLDKVIALNSRFIKENISPGGAADMLALTFFINSISKH